MFVKSSVTLLVVCAIFFGAVQANSESTDEQDCPQICPALYAPLCASNGKIFKEFSNTCELKTSNCRLRRAALEAYVATDMDWCSTELVADLDNLLVKLGNLSLTTPECLKPCAMIYSPICMSNGKYRAEVSNKCVMENFNCAAATKDIHIFKELKAGSC